MLSVARHTEGIVSVDQGPVQWGSKFAQDSEVAGTVGTAVSVVADRPGAHSYRRLLHASYVFSSNSNRGSTRL